MKIGLLLLLLLPLRLYAAEAPAPLPDDSIYQVNSLWLNSAGERLPLSSLRGSPVVISMVYLSCHYSCPLTISHMQKIAKDLPAGLKDKVKFVLVSFDPTHDTPAVMREYEQQRHILPPQWNFITSPDESDIRELAALLDFKYKAIAGGEFEHSFAILALDRDGVIRGRADGVDARPQDLIPLLK